MESPLARAIRLAASRLKRSPCSRARLLEHLLSKKCTDTEANAAADEMVRLGFLDEAAMADAIARAAEHKGPVARRAVEYKIARRGLDPTTTTAALDAHFEKRDPLTDAITFATQRLRTMSGSLNLQAKSRRLYSLLARQGFDEAMAEEAVRHVLGLDDFSG